jgi:murein DD-endopeptidase MepM/ murein hydrolase activator NlpD
MAQARTVTVSAWHVVFAALVLVAIVLAGSAFIKFTAEHAPGLYRVPVIGSVLDMTTTHEYAVQQGADGHADINAMAVKLSELQAQLLRLEALGERVAGLAGVNPQEFNFREPPPRGGSSSAGRNLSAAELQEQLDRLSSGIERRGDELNVVESNLMGAKLRSKMMPTSLPVAVTYNASGFGMRIDPFNGQMAMHEGIDFVANPGTPIVAAAGGVVIVAEWHHDFGNMIEIDHGNDITTLYAHASKLYVHVGDIVRRNQHIADVGGTGHATGPHLHFEVHVKGVPQNPAKFLEAGGAHQETLTAAAPVQASATALPETATAPPAPSANPAAVVHLAPAALIVQPAAANSSGLHAR